MNDLIDLITYDALRDLVPFVQSKRREKHLGRSVTFSKVAKFATLQKLTLFSGCLHVFKIIQMVPNRAKHHM